jgi:type IV fimbrial biogenesis protein FimT
MRNSRQWGITLPEFLIALALLVIFTSLAIPQTRYLIEKNRQLADSDLLLRNLQTARARAIAEKRTLLLCPSSSTECMEDWNDGWILKSAANNEILSQDKLSGLSGKLHWAGYRKGILFRSDGTSPTGNGRFFLCTPRGLAWQLIINRQGRIRVAEPPENAKDSHRCS